MKRIEVFISRGDADRRLGALEYDELRGKEVSSFELDGDFVLQPSVTFLGPDIGLFRGKQYPTLSYGFGLFQDAAPDSWNSGGAWCSRFSFRTRTITCATISYPKRGLQLSFSGPRRGSQWPWWI